MNKEAFYTGEWFHRVASDMIPDDWLCSATNDDVFWFIPSVVNMAFACELYLKALISNGEKVWGHRWSILFQQLSTEDQHAILNTPCFKGDPDFNRKIKENETVFEDWRYHFEPDKSICVDIIFLENFAITLHDLILEKQDISKKKKSTLQTE